MDDLISQASVQICSDGTFHITTTKIRRCHIDAVSCTEFAWMCIYNHLHAYTTWGFLKMNDPQVTMGFNSKMVELDDLGYDSNRWAVAPAGDFKCESCHAIGSGFRFASRSLAKDGGLYGADFGLQMVISCQIHNVSLHLDGWVLPICMDLYLSTLSALSIFFVISKICSICFGVFHPHHQDSFILIIFSNTFP